MNLNKFLSLFIVVISGSVLLILGLAYFLGQKSVKYVDKEVNNSIFIEDEISVEKNGGIAIKEEPQPKVEKKVEPKEDILPKKEEAGPDLGQPAQNQVIPVVPEAMKSDEIWKKAVLAMVNILCEDSNKNTYILGSGAIVHPKGYILTNGHLAEYFDKEGVSCILRRGSPAYDLARAKIIYLPEQASKINDSDVPVNDAAILKITSLVSGGNLPENFEYFEFDPFYRPKDGDSLYSLSYPSEFLGSQTLVANTTLLFTIGTVDKLITIDDDTANAEGAYLKGELSAQHGSSGGIFLDVYTGKISGLFVGLTEGKTTAERKQFIFLSSYIDSIIKKGKGLGLADFLSSNP